MEKSVFFLFMIFIGVSDAQVLLDSQQLAEQLISPKRVLISEHCSLGDTIPVAVHIDANGNVVSAKPRRGNLVRVNISKFVEDKLYSSAVGFVKGFMYKPSYARKSVVRVGCRPTLPNSQ